MKRNRIESGVVDRSRSKENIEKEKEKLRKKSRKEGGRRQLGAANFEVIVVH